MTNENRDLEGRDLLLGRPESASRAPPGVSSELIRAAEELRQAVEELRSTARDEELLRKILAAAQAEEPRPDEELLRELLEALRTLRADWPGDFGGLRGCVEGACPGTWRARPCCASGG